MAADGGAVTFSGAIAKTGVDEPEAIFTEKSSGPIGVGGEAEEAGEEDVEDTVDGELGDTG